MSTSSPAHYLTVGEYLKREERASSKHEYVDGLIFPICAVTKRHNVIAQNISRALHPKLRGTGCQVYISDVMVRVRPTNSFYYPDVMVTCSPYDPTGVIEDNPRLVVEVLSRSTAATDRREKVMAYKQVPSVREYLIVHQSRPRLELHRRTADGSWIFLEFGLRDDVILESLPSPTCLPARAIYEDVEWKKDWTVHEDSAADAYGVEGEENPDEDQWDENLEW